MSSHTDRASWIRTRECKDQNLVPYRLANALSSAVMFYKRRLNSSHLEYVFK